MRKTYIICKPNNTNLGVTFECAYCGKKIASNIMCRRTRCTRCDRKFKDIIKIERRTDDDVK